MSTVKREGRVSRPSRLLPAATLLFTVVTATPATAHEAASTAAPANGVAAIVTTCAAVLLAGMVAAPLWLGVVRPKPAWRHLPAVAALVTVAAIVAEMGRQVAAPPEALRLLIIGVLSACAGLVADRDSDLGAIVRPLLAIGLVVALCIRPGHTSAAITTLLLFAHVGAVAVWLGAVVHALRRIPSQAVAPRRVARWAAVAGVGSGISVALAHSTRIATDPAYSRMLTVKLAVIAAVMLAVAAIVRWRPGPALRTRGVALAGVVALGAMLAATPVIPVRRPIGPLATTITGPQGPISVLIAPYTAGPNEIVVTGGATPPQVTIGRRSSPVALRQRSPGVWWGRADLGAGAAAATVDGVNLDLDVARAVEPPRHRYAVQIPAGIGAPAMADCTHLIAGAVAAAADRGGAIQVVAGRHDSARTARLSLACAPEGGTGGIAPAVVGRQVARHLARNGHRSLTVLTSDDRRSRLLAAGARRAASTSDLSVRVVTAGTPGAVRGNEAVLVASDAAATYRALHGLRTGSNAGSRVVVMAPWLLQPEIVEGAADASRGAQLSFALGRDPGSAVARSYIAAAGALGSQPTAVGFEGYLWATAPRARKPARTIVAAERTDLQLFSPVNVGVMPSSMHDDHGPPTGGWVPAAALVAVSPVLG